MNISRAIKRKGLELGFSHVGITTADDFPELEQELLSREDYELWCDQAKYPDRTCLRQAARPREFYPAGKSIICLTYGYSQFLYPEELTPYVARAYLSRAYLPQPHSSVGVRAAEFKRYLQTLGIGVYEGGFELPERASCARAGIITYGKNNFAYTKEDGSFNILFSFLVDTELSYDVPSVRCDCPPDCRRCIDACPSQAILAPGRLHPQNCLLFNHMAAPGKIPEELWEKMGTRIHGCDECQAACPRNQAVLKRSSRPDFFLEELKQDFDPEKILLLDDAYYQDVVEPIMYNYIRDYNIFRRNAAIALGNSGDPSHIPALKKALTYEDKEVKKAVQWAICRLSAQQEDV